MHHKKPFVCKYDICQVLRILFLSLSSCLQGAEGGKLIFTERIRRQSMLLVDSVFQQVLTAYRIRSGMLLVFGFLHDREISSQNILK